MEVIEIFKKIKKKTLPMFSLTWNKPVYLLN